MHEKRGILYLKQWILQSENSDSELADKIEKKARAKFQEKFSCQWAILPPFLLNVTPILPIFTQCYSNSAHFYSNLLEFPLNFQVRGPHRGEYSVR